MGKEAPIFVDKGGGGNFQNFRQSRVWDFGDFMPASNVSPSLHSAEPTLEGAAALSEVGLLVGEGFSVGSCGVCDPLGFLIPTAAAGDQEAMRVVEHRRLVSGKIRRGCPWWWGGRAEVKLTHPWLQ